MASDCDSGLLARLPDNQDSYALVDCPNDSFVSNARTLLGPVSESDGVALRATADSDSMPDIWFNVEHDELRAINAWDSGIESNVKTGLEAVIQFAHTYGHNRHQFSAEPVEEAPEVLQ